MVTSAPEGQVGVAEAAVRGVTGQDSRIRQHSRRAWRRVGVSRAFTWGGASQDEGTSSRCDGRGRREPGEGTGR